MYAPHFQFGFPNLSGLCKLVAQILPLNLYPSHPLSKHFPFLFSIFLLIIATSALAFLFFIFLLIMATLANKNYKYDLFVSHRGPDVKKTIAGCLYYWLRSHGLQVFLDKQELEGGLKINIQIEEAIASASLHVVVFSPGYADSKWCLDELHLIIESGKPIIPIFYKVKPADLRQAQENRGAYADALKKHELRHDSTTVANWRKALSIAADNSGFDLHTLNGDEGKLMNKVVKCVLKRVKSPNLVDVGKHTFGLDGKAQDFHGQLRALTGKLLKCLELVARPWRGIKGFNGGIEEFNDLSHATKWIMRISFEDMHCKKCNRMALHLIAAVEGVYSITVNTKEMNVTVIGSADPLCLMGLLRRKFRFAELLSLGPAQENKF